MNILPRKRTPAPEPQVTPYARLLSRLFEIHDTDAGQCSECRVSPPCDTMRAVWIYDLEIRPQDGPI